MVKVSYEILRDCTVLDQQFVKETKVLYFLNLISQNLDLSQ